jgi:hypothetical protein
LMQIIFTIFAVSEVFSSERAQKMPKNEALDVKKFDDTAENEPLQNSKNWKIGVYYAWSDIWWQWRLEIHTRLFSILDRRAICWLAVLHHTVPRVADVVSFAYA